jgi:hypothetical protein
MRVSTTVAVPGEGGEQKISGMGRVIGVLTNPKETFTDIVRKPSVLMPIIIMAVLGCAVAFMMNQRIDWYAYIRHQIEISPRAGNMSADQINQAAQVQSRFSPPFAYVIGVLGGLVFPLIMGLVYWGSFSLFGGISLRFKQAWAIATHASLTSLVSTPMLLLVLFLKERGDVTPENMLVSSAAGFLSDDAPRWLASIASSFELFWFWTMFLLAVGFAAINPRKLSTGKALGIIVGVWLVWVLIKAGLAAAFS